MRVFVTGASGFVGSAIVQELLGAGHQVLGLARSDESAKALIAAGTEVHRGALTDLDSLRSGASGVDGVIHTAFIHDFSKFAENCEIDRQAIEALSSALAGTERPLIITSGTGLLTPGRLGTEDDQPLSNANIPRVASEEAAALAVSRGIRAAIVRLPPSVHGDGDHGFVPALIGIAREKGVSAYLNEGLNQWPSVHRLDAAKLYRLALEQGAKHLRYHATDEQGVPFKDIATVIGKRLNIPVVSKSTADAPERFTWMTHFVGMNSPASSAQTREWLGWQPTNIGLIEDLETGTYFD